MVKVNSNQAKKNIENYILEYQNVAERAEWIGIQVDDNNIVEVSNFIIATFYSEYVYGNHFVKNKNIFDLHKTFYDYCAGLPSILDTCYFYNRNAADDIAIILEETDDEKEKYIKKYSESDCEKLLSYWIYRRLIANYKEKLFNQYYEKIRS